MSSRAAWTSPPSHKRPSFASSRSTRRVRASARRSYTSPTRLDRAGSPSPPSWKHKSADSSTSSPSSLPSALRSPRSSPSSRHSRLASTLSPTPRSKTRTSSASRSPSSLSDAATAASASPALCPPRRLLRLAPEPWAPGSRSPPSRVPRCRPTTLPSSSASRPAWTESKAQALFFGTVSARTSSSDSARPGLPPPTPTLLHRSLRLPRPLVHRRCQRCPSSSNPRATSSRPRPFDGPSSSLVPARAWPRFAGFWSTADDDALSYSSPERRSARGSGAAASPSRVSRMTSRSPDARDWPRTAPQSVVWAPSGVRGP